MNMYKILHAENFWNILNPPGILLLTQVLKKAKGFGFTPFEM